MVYDCLLFIVMTSHHRLAPILLVTCSPDPNTTTRFTLTSLEREQIKGNITILARLPLVASGAEARVVPDADSCVFTRRLARRFGVKHETDRDSARRVGARSGAQTRQGEQQRGDKDRGGEPDRAHG